MGSGSQSHPQSGTEELRGPHAQSHSSTLANLVRDQHWVRCALEEQPAKRDSRAVGQSADSADVVKIRLRRSLDLDLADTRCGEQTREASDIEIAPGRRTRHCCCETRVA